MSSEHYTWLTTARSKSQQLILDLYLFGKQNCGTLPCNTTYRDIFADLVGATFSLWRAATLSDTELNWIKNIEDANELLKALIEDNAVPYQKERKTKEWMGGYYLNNALHRLKNLLEKESKEWVPNNTLKEFLDLKATGIAERKPSECWCILYNVLESMTENLKKQRP